MAIKISSKFYDRSLFIFRRDLRLDDNTALMRALEESEQVYPVFIFDQRQYSSANPYRSLFALRFMADSLMELDAELRSKGSYLFVIRGIAEQVVDSLIKELDVEAIYINKDYTPFSISRDTAISRVCKEQSVQFVISSDYLLVEDPETFFAKSGKPYTVFTHFLKAARKVPVRAPQKNSFTNYARSNNIRKGFLGAEEWKNLIDYHSLPELSLDAGRTAGKKILSTIGKHKDYTKKRDYPFLSATTGLSPHHKFGTVSIRESYYAISTALGSSHDLIRELYWRDFFTYVAFYFPHVFKGAFKHELDNLKWSDNKDWFEAWKNGKTGVPIVDAGMRELLATGKMHNRVRMITASFLVKDLLIDWRKGEQHFAFLLVDYDPCVNNGSWQWVASTGCDAVPWFRIFNPWVQQKKFDPECKYIKKWVPELSALQPEEIHDLEHRRPSVPIDYPEPIVNHKEQVKKVKKLYSMAL